jgi:hypothetical protein
MALGSGLPINSGTCPKYGKVLRHVKVEQIDILNFSQSWKGASFVCPHCNVVLSVGLDPVQLNADLVDEILKKLGRKR